jgi:hypothetical protein
MFTVCFKNRIVDKVSKRYEYKYLGDQQSIDINTLLVSQFHFAAMLNEIQKEVFPTENLKIKIESFKEGTFNVNHLIDIYAVGGLVLVENAEYISTLFNVLMDYISLKQLLGGKKAENVTTIENGNIKIEIKVDGNNNCLVVNERAFNIYRNNATMDKAFLKNIESLEKDEQIDGIEIKEIETQKKVISIPRENFSKLKDDNLYIEEGLKNDLIKARLFIRKPDIVPQNNKVKWCVIHQGKSIDVNIIDKIFKEKIKKGISISTGDSIVGDMEIYLNFDDRLNTYVRTGRYDLIKVYRVEEGHDPFQIKLNLSDEADNREIVE